MKKLTLLIFLILSSSLLIFSCSKDDDEQQEKTLKTVVKFMFNEESDLDDWSFKENDSATMIIDTEDKVEGAGSLKVQDGCCVIGAVEEYSLKKNTNYKFSFDIKYNEMPDENSCGGAFRFMLYLEHGSNWEAYGIFQEQTGWYYKEFYYNTGEEDSPIKFSIRSEVKDIWVDQFIVEEAD
jgi:hypothetical protein